MNRLIAKNAINWNTVDLFTGANQNNTDLWPWIICNAKLIFERQNYEHKSWWIIKPLLYPNIFENYIFR